MLHSTSYEHVLSRACNQPQFLEPTYATTFFSSLALRSGLNQLVSVNGDILDKDEMVAMTNSFSRGRDRERPYQVLDGLAVLPISGTLLHKFGYLQPRSGSTGYDGIIARINDAIHDPEIKAIMLDIDSPGGEAAGLFDCANQIKKLREIKPIYALCYDTMCSAAMAIGSACTERWITQSGRAGSVGVVVAHRSIEKKLEEDGVVITLIHSGKHKVDGNPYTNLPKEVREKIQANIDKSRDSFAELVSNGIGISKSAVLETEAQIYTGQEAIDVGFANKLVNGQEAVPVLLDILKSNNSIGVSMSTQQNSPPENKGGDTTQATFSQSDLDRAKMEGATLERERISQILSSEHAEGRQKMATHLALSTNMSAEDSTNLLLVSPKEQSQAQGEQTHDKSSMSNALDEAMNSTEQPNLNTSGDGAELSDIEKEEQELLSAHDSVFGK
ncbi:S49 family peptidase [Pseudoalteromonas luteoviolacea]|uniref:S49 family peptidase n=1 Tax=Pseudoalteromonas luteoviolacea TaxID=43657 RepID=UPI001B38B861|nr:S49 family peptidase [Pseudoalteromonas luteoviolacea]MBQ4836047.1 S49 family peptidase [Pseudoalteromonas luteoviolacea]